MGGAKLAMCYVWVTALNIVHLPPAQPSNVFIGGSEMLPEYKIGDYGTMREQGRKHLHYFVSVCRE